MRKTLTNDEAIALYVKKHGDRYDYSRTRYNGQCQKVVVTCRVHGDFLIQHNNHAYGGYGCNACSPIGRPKAERAVCGKHGEYVLSKGCSICKAYEKRKTAFINKCIKKHGDLYDYSYIDFVNQASKIEVLCRTCNEKFTVHAGNHSVRGVGCQKCHRGRGGFDKKKAGYLYVLQSNGIFKIGITNSEVSVRAKFVSSRAGVKFDIVKYVKFEDGEKCVRAEAELLSMVSSAGYERPDLSFDGYTECFVAKTVPPDVIEYMEMVET
jgi:hypothetical protein